MLSSGFSSTTRSLSLSLKQSVPRTHGQVRMMSDSADIYEKAITGPDTTLKTSYMSRPTQSGAIVTLFGASSLHGREILYHIARSGAQMVLPFRFDGLDIRALRLLGDLGQVVPFKVDFKDQDSIKRAVEKSDVVVNCISRQYETLHSNFNNVHCEIPKNIAKACRETGVPRFVHLSALGAKSKHESNFLSSKGRGEEAVRSEFSDATIIRPGFIAGEFDDFFTLLVGQGLSRPRYPLWQTMFWPPLMWSEGIPIVHPNKYEQKLQPIVLQDLAKGVFQAMSDPNSIGSTYDFGGDRVYTFLELVNMLFEHFPCDPLFREQPRPYLQIRSRHSQVFGSTWDVINSTGEGARTLTDLGVKPTPLDELIAKMYKGKIEDSFFTAKWGRLQPSQDTTI